MFFRHIIEAFFVRTEPDSSIVKPAAIHITRAPHSRKANVLKMNTVSVSGPAAWAIPGLPRKKPSATVASPARPITRVRLANTLASVAVKFLMSRSIQFCCRDCVLDLA